MEKAYIILAHHYPDQVYRLVERLDDRLSVFFIHIDKKTDISEFREVLELDKVQLVERVKLHWAGLSFVKAILNGLVAVKESGKTFDRIILLSGQDYPIKSNAFINNFLHSSPFKVFLEYFLLPNHAKWQPGGGMYRVNKYYFGLKAYQTYTARTFNFLSRYIPSLRRTLPGNIKPFAGSTWWIIDMYALHYILDYIDNNPAYTAFHKHTFAPDEIFFQTILMNTTDQRLADSISNNNMRLIKWKDIKAAHPQEMTRSDMNDILTSDALFARKFNLHENPEILDLIDLYCLSENYSLN